MENVFNAELDFKSTLPVEITKAATKTTASVWIKIARKKKLERTIVKDSTVKIKTVFNADKTPTVGLIKSAETMENATAETNFARPIKLLLETSAVPKIKTENVFNAEIMPFKTAPNSKGAMLIMNVLAILKNARNILSALKDKKIKLMVNAP